MQTKQYMNGDKKNEKAKTIPQGGTEMPKTHTHIHTVDCQ